MFFFVFFCLFLFQFKKSPPKIPYKAIALATVLFLIGAFLIIIGSLLLAGYISKGVSWGACGISRRCLKCQPLCCLLSSTAYFSRKKKRWFLFLFLFFKILFSDNKMLLPLSLNKLLSDPMRWVWQVGKFSLWDVGNFPTIIVWNSTAESSTEDSWVIKFITGVGCYYCNFAVPQTYNRS